MYGSSLNNQLSVSNNKPFTKIFCPQRCINQKSGYLIGINTSSFVLCVADIVSDIPYSELEIILNKMSFDRRMMKCPLGGHSPKILGEWIGFDKGSLQSPNNLHDLDIWISMERSEYGDPILRKIICNEYKFQTSTQIVLYDDTPPYYYTSIPIKFESYFENLSNKSKVRLGSNSNNTSSNNSVFSPKSSSEDPSNNSLIKKQSKQSDLESFLKQINCTNDIKIILLETIQKHQARKKQILLKQQESNITSPSSLSSSSSIKRSNNDSDTDSESTSTSTNNSLFSKTLFTLRFRNRQQKSQNTNNNNNNNNSSNDNISLNNSSSNISPPLSPNLNQNIKNSNSNSSSITPPIAVVVEKPNFLKKIKYYLFSPLNLLFWIFQLIIKLTMNILNFNIYGGQKLKDLTIIGTHLDNRIQQFRYLIQQWNYLTAKKYWFNNNEDRSSFIEFHNSCWLLLNDVVLGIIAGILLNIYSSEILNIIGKFNFYVNNDLFKSLILWIMGWPGGFKLNENLDNFFGRLVLYYIDKWNLITTTIAPHGLTCIKLVSISGIFGVSYLICILVDMFSIFTMHVTVFYSVSARFYLLQLRLLNSLWNLFRGKKFNPLRKRIDSVDFDVNQLLLGTLLFTLIFFLFPTTAIYYFFFTLFKAIVGLFQGSFNLLLHLINTFPLFSLVIYLINPKYIPGGVTINIKQTNQQKHLQQQQEQLVKQQQEQLQKQQLQQQQDADSKTSSPKSTINNVTTTSTAVLSPPKPSHHIRNLSGTLLPLLNDPKPIINTNSSANNSTNSTPGTIAPQVKFNISHNYSNSNSSNTTPTGLNIGGKANSSIHHHRRNLSLSSQGNSPLIPRVSQMEITYFTIQIQPAPIMSFFTPTSQLFQYVIQTYHPVKLIKCLFSGASIFKT